ncbi:MAG: gliding motility protein GldM [Flammeovirgaceae bacterium]|nr:gliding motility protein GldM [Flammeovirgaceae bacterium]
MAGGKETPRQKMIGMMYLVLTALLALQVSSAVLEKFAIINVTLEELMAETETKNAIMLLSIQEAGSKLSNPEAKRAVENAKKVRELTKVTNTQIEELKKTMISLSNATEVNEGVINDHGSKVATMMIDPRSNVGKDFEKLLNDYVAQLGTLTGKPEEFTKIAKPPAEMHFFAEDPDHNKKDFLTFMFENTPVIAALASVTQLQTEVMEHELKALDVFAGVVDAKVLKFDKIVPMVRPKARVVAAGDKYEADMFITASASGETPEMFRNGEPLEVVDDPMTGVKMGKVSFRATANFAGNSTESKQTFSAEIKLKDSLYKIPIEYTVVKPTIRVTTGTAPTLYMNCGNLVNIEVPALGTNYNPSFTAKGATIVRGDKASTITIIPKERKVSVNVINDGVSLGAEGFDVKNIPRPHYVAKDNNGREIDLKNGARGAGLTGLRVSAEPDENFKNEVPKDANYRIRSMEVILARGTARVATLNVNSELIDTNQWRSQFRPGDRIIVDIKTVTRRTFQGEDERVEIKSEVITIPIQ